MLTEIRTPLTVTQLTVYLKARLEEDPRLNGVLVSGEISNFTNHYKSGHFYFSLKDERSVLRAVMFARNASRLRFVPQDGMRVLARGRISLYEASGQYQLYVDELQPDGLGALSLAFEQLKEKLRKEGLFAPERKRPLPPFPERVGIITSPTGAAVHDMLTILARRWPLAQVVFCPVQVQGEAAAPQLVEALRRMNEQEAADVILIGRGGGSLEDLWAFNEEIVARAVAASRIPVVSAVGHETDVTICDFAADLRAPTPSAAAELAVPDRAEWMAALQAQRGRMASLMQSRTAALQQRLDLLTASRTLREPLSMTQNRAAELELLRERMHRAQKALLDRKESRAAELTGKLHALSPLSVLARGYALAEKEQEETTTLISSAADLSPGEIFTLRFADGKAVCRAKSVALHEEGECAHGCKEDDV